tara:strand:- start:607 stop:780 length:174 start_codon:yes stop_codon:yes gene_type:complete
MMNKESDKESDEDCQRCGCFITPLTGRIFFDGENFCRDCGLDEMDECGMDDFHGCND